MPRKKHVPKNNKNNIAFLVVIGLIIVVAASVLIFTSTSASAFDYSTYTYTDEDIASDDEQHIIEEYADFQCPYCQQMAPIMKRIKQDFPVRVEYKHFPLSQIHPYALTAAEASECARDQGKFWAFHDVLMDSKKLTKSDLFKHANGIGLDESIFKVCVNNRDKQILVEQQRQEGIDRGVTGTPSLFLDGEVLTARTYNDIARELSQ